MHHHHPPRHLRQPWGRTAWSPPGRTATAGPGRTTASPPGRAADPPRGRTADPPPDRAADRARRAAGPRRGGPARHREPPRGPPPGPDPPLADPAVPAARPRLREHPRTRRALVAAAGGPHRPPLPAVAALVGAAAAARDLLRGPAGPGAPGRRVIAGMEDQALVAGGAAGRQVRVAGRPDHRPPRRGHDHQHPHRPVRQHRRAARPGTGCCTCSTPRASAACRRPSGGTPLRGCDQPAVALQRAASFTAATESRGLHDMAFWIGKASSVLASLLHAAALDGRTMNDVYQWAHGIDDAVPEQILAAHPAAAERLARPDPRTPPARPDRRLDPDDRDPRAVLVRRPRRRRRDLTRPGRRLRRRRVRLRREHPVPDRHRPRRSTRSRRCSARSPSTCTPAPRSPDRCSPTAGSTRRC